MKLKWCIVSFSHESGEIFKQFSVDCKVTGVIHNLKDNTCF
jgi:hypothetical protein